MVILKIYRVGGLDLLLAPLEPMVALGLCCITSDRQQQGSAFRWWTAFADQWHLLVGSSDFEATPGCN
jgi:hypothetical protein